MEQCLTSTGKTHDFLFSFFLSFFVLFCFVFFFWGGGRGVMGAKLVSKLGFSHFLKVASLVFLDNLQDCSLGQYLTFSRAKTSKITDPYLDQNE